MGRAAARKEDLSERAAQLVDSSFVFDATQVFRMGGPGKPRLPLGDIPIEAGMIEEWRSAGLNGFLHPFAIFSQDIYAGQIKVLAMWNGFIADHSDSVMRLDEPADFDRARQSGKLLIMLGSHHAEPFRTPDDVNYFASLGLKSCILTTFGQNRLGTAVDEPGGGGLTNYGRAIVRRMNEVGMAVDVSHCNDRTRRDAIEASVKPVLMSHANPAAKCPNPRNVGDDVIKALAERGGVMGVMPLRMLLTPQEPTTIEDYIDHIAYLCDLVGPEHAALGLETPPEGFDTLPPESQIPLPSYMRNPGVQRKLDLPELCHIRRMYTVVEAMLARGFGDEEIRGIVGGNVERVVREVLAV